MLATCSHVTLWRVHLEYLNVGQEKEKKKIFISFCISSDDHSTDILMETSHPDNPGHVQPVNEAERVCYLCATAMVCQLAIPKLKVIYSREEKKGMSLSLVKLEAEKNPNK